MPFRCDFRLRQWLRKEPVSSSALRLVFGGAANKGSESGAPVGALLLGLRLLRVTA